jgi:hypothetical protein
MTGFMSTRPGKLTDSSIAYRSEVPERNSPLVVQGLQIGGTSVALVEKSA